MDTKLDDIFNHNKKVIITEDSEKLDSSLELETSSLLGKSFVPYSHRRVADNYVIMKRICGFQIVQPRITNVEIGLLAKYGLKTLENTNISAVNNEILKLKEWATSTDDTLRADADELLKIRVKELKFILSDNYTLNSDEMYNGYKAVDAYLTNITKYYN